MNRSPDILRHLVRRFGVLVALTVVGAIAGGAYGLTKAPTYVAEAHVVVTAQPGEFLAAVNFAQAYGRIVTAGPVADDAAKALGSRADLDRVTASTSPDAPVIEIVAAGPDAARTATVANAVAKALVDFGTKRKDQTRVTVAVLAAAAVPTAPASPKPPMEAAIGAVAGLLIGGLAVLAGVGRPAAKGIRVESGRAAIAEHPPRPALPARHRAFYAGAPNPQVESAYPPVHPGSVDGSALESTPTGDRVVGRAAVIWRTPR
jgi:uncharacterized protein involved in exopolysaccharide biosynthesis